MGRTLDAIIDTAERLEGPDRRLDLEIALQAGHVVRRVMDGADSYFRFDGDGDPEEYPFMEAPAGQLPDPGNACRRYTGSWAVAMLLANQATSGWYLEHAGDNAVGDPGLMRVTGHCVEYSDGADKVGGDAPTKALAYCLAALKVMRHKGRAFTDTVLGRLVEAEIRDAVRKDVETVLGHFNYGPVPPEIEVDEDDGSVVLRWERGRDTSFSMTFLGEGNVGGVLLQPGYPGRGWKHGVGDTDFLTATLNGPRLWPLLERGRR